MRTLLVVILSVAITLSVIGQKSSLDKKQLLGVWLTKADLVQDFEIRKDSIYYIDQEKSYKYVLTKADTLIIYFDGFINKSKVIIRKDTLILAGDNTDFLYEINNT